MHPSLHTKNIKGFYRPCRADVIGVDRMELIDLIIILILIIMICLVNKVLKLMVKRPRKGKYDEDNKRH